MTSQPTAEAAACAAVGLLAEHTAGTWAPTPKERTLAEGIACVGPSATSLRTGRFADVLARRPRTWRRSPLASRTSGCCPCASSSSPRAPAVEHPEQGQPGAPEQAQGPPAPVDPPARTGPGIRGPSDLRRWAPRADGPARPYSGGRPAQHAGASAAPHPECMPVPISMHRLDDSGGRRVTVRRGGVEYVLGLAYRALEGDTHRGASAQRACRHRLPAREEG